MGRFEIVSCHAARSQFSLCSACKQNDCSWHIPTQTSSHRNWIGLRIGFPSQNVSSNYPLKVSNQQNTFSQKKTRIASDSELQIKWRKGWARDGDHSTTQRLFTGQSLQPVFWLAQQSSNPKIGMAPRCPKSSERLSGYEVHSPTLGFANKPSIQSYPTLGFKLNPHPPKKRGPIVPTPSIHHGFVTLHKIKSEPFGPFFSGTAPDTQHGCRLKQAKSIQIKTTRQPLPAMATLATNTTIEHLIHQQECLEMFEVVYPTIWRLESF